MKKKALALPLALLLGSGLSCDMNSTQPPTTGAIDVILITPSGSVFANATAADAAMSDLVPVDAQASVALTSARLSVSGPTSKTVTATSPGASGFELAADGLAPGTYSVTVEGLANGQVAHFGQASTVTVIAGQTARPTVTFPVFQPQIPDAAVEDTSDVLRYTVSWAAVQNAASYLVEWSQSPAMTGASSQSVTGATSVEITVPSEGKWYFTVKAVNTVVASGGLASVVKPVFLFQGVATVSVSPTAPSVVAGGTQQMAAEGRDADNGVVSNVTWFWASSNHTVATVDQTGLVSAIAPGTAVITAVGKGMPGSTTVTVTAAPLPPATKLAFVSQPTTTVAGQTMSSVQVAVQTAGGQTVTTDDATQVVLSIGTNPGGSTLGGTLTTTVVDGIATFSDLTLNKSGSGYVLSAVAAGLTTGNSSAFSITAGAPNRLAFSIQPTNSIAGDALSPAVQVEIRDANDNLVTTARDEITIAFGNNAGSGTLTGTKKVNAINGIASFTGLWVNKSATGYTLAASSGSLTAATSSGFDISPAAPAKLSFSQQPTTVQGNAPITPAVTVTIADQFDNQTTATNNVTVSLESNPWKTPFANGAALSGTLTTAANNGVATFANLRIDKPAPGYTLRTSSGALSAATSAEFNTNLTISQVATAVGGSHTCAISASGTYCWGANFSGQLGAITGNTGTDSIPTLTRGGLTFTQVTVGNEHSCGLTSSGAVYCWGRNAEGQLGNNSTTPSDVPVQVVASGTTLIFAQIDAGGYHTCGVTTSNGLNNAFDRQVYCWGYNFYGQIGDATNGGGTNKLVPTRVADGGAGFRTAEALQVSAGYYFTCARAANSSGFCWGYNFNGQLGDGSALDINGNNGVNQNVPVLITGGTLWSSISAGGFHACGVAANPGTPARCWGAGTSGQLGNDATTNTSTPSLVFGGLAWASIGAGGSHTCGVLTTGVGYCWGNNGNGELGDDNQPTDSDQPVQVIGSTTFERIDSGAGYSCGRSTTSQVFCWGANFSGQLGSPGTNAVKKVPTQIIQ